MAVDRKKRTFLCGVVEGFYGKPWNHRQRKILFARMKHMGMNVYLYAPKDDKKHRIDWRDLYSVEEMEHMKSLIEEAKRKSIIFVYAISPGIDITYSSTNEVNCLKRKLSQVADMGCDAFALLFDDIEPVLKSADKTVYKSIGQAQAELTNRVFNHLNSPETFIFCPTEYCATRAVPDVENSEYLRSIGSRLEQGIDIMWTGRMVISKTITAEEMKAIGEVLQRPPLIWDNIHANDYDPKRVYLGPYSGRSPELRPLLRGVMTNPNCEFEANFVAMCTLAAWSHSDVDEARKERLMSSSPLRSDIQLEVDGGDVDMGGYQPRQALQAAVVDWLTIMYLDEAPDLIESDGKTICHESKVDPILAWGSTSLGNPKDIPPSVTDQVVTDEAEMVDSSLVDLPRAEPPPAPIPPVSHDLIEDDAVVIPTPVPVSAPSTPPPPTAVLGENVELPEPMEYDLLMANPNSSHPPSPVPSPGETIIRSPTPIVEEKTVCDTNPVSPLSEPKVDDGPDVIQSSDAMETTPTGNPEVGALASVLSVEEVCLLIDLCYLPYEHGPLSSHMLDMYLWLRGNAQIMSQVREARRKNQSDNDGGSAVDSRPSAVEDDDPNVREWFTKAEQFSNFYRQVCSMCSKLCHIANTSLLHDIYPYVSEVRRSLSLLDAYLKWLANGQNLSVSFLQQLITWPSYKECFVSGNYEAWHFRGGLVTEFLRMVPLEGVQDLLLAVIPEEPTSNIFEVRPYTATDKEAVYEIARRCTISKAEEELPSDVSAEREIVGERTVGAFLSFSEDFCFVTEDTGGNVCGYAVGAVSCSKFIAAVRENCADNKKLMPWLDHHEGESCGDTKLEESALIRVEMAPDLGEDSLEACRRLLACLFSTLRTVGVTTVHCPFSFTDDIDLYRRLGFTELHNCMTRTIAVPPSP